MLRLMLCPRPRSNPAAFEGQCRDASGLPLEPILIMVWVYLRENPQGRFYLGQTEDFPARLPNHNRTDTGAGKYTRKRGPWR